MPNPHYLPSTRQLNTLYFSLMHLRDWANTSQFSRYPEDLNRATGGSAAWQEYLDAAEKAAGPTYAAAFKPWMAAFVHVFGVSGNFGRQVLVPVAANLRADDLTTLRQVPQNSRPVWRLGEWSVEALVAELLLIDMLHQHGLPKPWTVVDWANRDVTEIEQALGDLTKDPSLPSHIKPEVEAEQLAIQKLLARFQQERSRLVMVGHGQQLQTTANLPPGAAMPSSAPPQHRSGVGEYDSGSDPPYKMDNRRWKLPDPPSQTRSPDTGPGRALLRITTRKP